MPRGFRPAQGGSSGIDLRIEGANEIERVARALKAEGGTKLRREFGKALQKEGKPAVAEARRNVMALDVKGARGGGGSSRVSHGTRVRFSTDSEGEEVVKTSLGRSGLRDVIARATRMEIKWTGRSVGVRIFTDGRKLPADQRSLPRHMNKGSWRHPVFGTDAWVTQTASPAGWFDRAMDKHKDDMRRAMVRVMEKFAERIDRAG